MTSATEHCRVVLSAIIPSRKDLLDKAIKQLIPEHFPDVHLKGIFSLLQLYRDKSGGGILTRDALSGALKNRDAGTLALYEELYDALSATKVEDTDFRWSIDQIKDIAAEKATDSAIVEAKQIMVRGLEDDKGNILKGHKDAREFFLRRVSEIESQFLIQEAPEGDIRDEGPKILSEYSDGEKRKLEGKGQGILFGIPPLDAKIGGIRDGYFVLIAASSGTGKSTLLAQLAWHATVIQGLNVAFMTTETVRPNMITKILCRHSMQPQFGLPNGLDSYRVMNYLLDDKEKAIFKDVVDDYTHNPEYGHSYIKQMPEGATVNDVKSALVQEQNKYHVNLCLVDYWQQFTSERRRGTDREEQMLVVQAGQQLAQTFDDGRGIPIISPWQMNRSGKNKAKEMGFFEDDALGDTSEAFRASDLVLTLLEKQSAEGGRYADADIQAIKYRYGPKTAAIPIRIDYATGTFTGRGGGARMDSLIGTANLGNLL